MGKTKKTKGTRTRRMAFEIPESVLESGEEFEISICEDC